MAQRFPPLPLEEPAWLTEKIEAAQKIQEKDGQTRSRFTYKGSDGLSIGPVAVMLYTPDIFSPMMAFGDAVINNFEFRLVELGILAVASSYEVPFMIAAHKRNAIAAGFTEEQVSLACEVKIPQDLNEQETVAFKTALELANKRGPVAEQI